ncbi:hypothetical protein RSOLAG22IIIB_08849 [Rhizoctonia solani]|uniref:Jacalin-type lectin domain-containing protein n=1 Tax=Rhizoctonia solani TaxID=456999 RepID=A0A0K6FV04_9AGAM|nr:hypothetical protein RSOLAG22IIIB_08849 [Rhizoctonia solani]
MRERDETSVPPHLICGHGFTLDSSDGPIRSGRRAIQQFSRGVDLDNPEDANYVKKADGEKVFEDEYSKNRLGALYTHSGWPPPGSIPEVPRGSSDAKPRVIESDRWATRRIMVPMWSITLRVDNLSPAEALVRAVEDALARPNDVSRIRALDEVFASWGDIIPVVAIVGSVIAATGVIPSHTNLKPISSFPEPNNQVTFRDLNTFIDAQLQIEGKFERVLEYHVTGGRPDILLRNGFDTWLDNIKTTRGWEIIKVTQAIPITDILDHTIQQKIKELYANHSILFRSPTVGVSSKSEFDSTVNGFCPIQRIEIGVSNTCVKSLLMYYANGQTAGPYGHSGHAMRVERFDLTLGEFITDIFIWPSDHSIASIQLVKNTGYISPIYGATRGVTQPPHLLSGNGKALAGLSGGYDEIGIAQLQAIWRKDLEAANYRAIQTSFVGGADGDLWNDLKFIADRSTARISGITARSPGTGYLSSLQTTYTSRVGGYPAHQESPIHGTEDGPITSWALGDNQCITGVRGRYDGTSICELQFITNRNESPAFGKPGGNFNFNFPAPETQGGNKMVLHYMAGKSARRVNSIIFVWADSSQQV